MKEYKSVSLGFILLTECISKPRNFVFNNRSGLLKILYSPPSTSHFKKSICPILFKSRKSSKVRDFIGIELPYFIWYLSGYAEVGIGYFLFNLENNDKQDEEDPDN